LLREVSAETGVDVRTLRDPIRRLHIVAVRREFAIRAKSERIGIELIAVALNRTTSAVCNMVYEKVREQKRRQHRRRRERLAAESVCPGS
jgi:hypothetical protein